MITVLQPDAGVPLERFTAWFAEADAGVRVVALSEEPVPGLEDVRGGVLLLGGQGSALDETRYPWLPEVRALLREAVEEHVPVLGICLGHQVLADALGGRVSVADPLGGEDGPVLVRWLEGAASDPVLGGVASDGPAAIVPQSHHDVVAELPPGAEELAVSATYRNQAFRLGSALGVQFHPEASPELMARWAANEGHDPDAMRAAMEAVDPEAAAMGRSIAVAFARFAG